MAFAIPAGVCHIFLVYDRPESLKGTQADGIAYINKSILAPYSRVSIFDFLAIFLTSIIVFLCEGCLKI